MSFITHMQPLHFMRNKQRLGFITFCKEISLRSQVVRSPGLLRFMADVEETRGLHILGPLFSPSAAFLLGSSNKIKVLCQLRPCPTGKLWGRTHIRASSPLPSPANDFSSTSFWLLLKNYLNNAEMFINGKYLTVKALNTYRWEFSHYDILISALSLNAGPEVTQKLALTKGQLLWAR